MKTYLGIDLGGTLVRVGEVEENGRLNCIISASSNALDSKEKIIDNIIELVNKFNLTNVEAIGIGVPGPVNQKNGSMYIASNIPALKDVSLTEEISKRVNKKVYIDNDANVAGLAEAILGAGSDNDIVYYITHSTGIGGALIVDKKIISGRKGFAGEVANICVRPNGRTSENLVPGAVESEASGTAIGKKGKEIIGDHIKSAKDVFDLAKVDDEKALKIVDEMSKDFALMLSDITATVAPDCFVIGGGCTKASDIYFDKIEKYFKEYVHDFNADTPIYKAKLEEPGVLGAALLAISKEK